MDTTGGPQAIIGPLERLTPGRGRNGSKPPRQRKPFGLTAVEETGSEPSFPEEAQREGAEKGKIDIRI